MKVLGVMTRIYLVPANLDDAVAFYETLLGVKCDLRFECAEAGLELAGVGPMLLIAGSEEKLHSFRQTQATIIVDYCRFDRGLQELAAGGWGSDLGRAKECSDKPKHASTPSRWHYN